MKKSKPSETCTWAIKKFPRKIKNRFIAYCRANNVLVSNHTQYVIAKELREVGLNIPLIDEKK